MKRCWFWLVVVWCPFFTLGEAAGPPTHASTQPHRSPVDVVVLPGGRYALSANHTADSVSLVDLEAGKVLAEQPCGRKPAGVACSRDGRLAAVSNLWSGTLTLLEIHGTRLRSVGDVAVGSMPRGVVFAPDGRTLYVALAGTDEVIALDWRTRQTVRRWPANREPRRLALTRDGRFLVAASLRSAQVRCWDTRTGELAWERTLRDSFNLQGLAISPDDRDVITAQVRHRHHRFLRANIEEGWALNSRIGHMAIKPGKTAWSQAALDIRNRAVGDPSAVAFATAGDLLAVAAGGTQEMLVLPAAKVDWVDGEPRDFLDGALWTDDRFRRIHLGGRPLALQFIENTPRVVVANYLLDSLQIVDARDGKLLRSVALGGPPAPSLVRQGEAIFYDARRSLHQWFSCSTCHTDGHTSGQVFDTMSEDDSEVPKLAPSLRGVTRTGPWNWHGWQASLPASVEKSFVNTMIGKKPSAHDVKAVVAYLGTLDYPPSPHLRPDGGRGPAAERGKALFVGKANCTRCHRGGDYTSKANYDVKLPSDGSRYDKWNPPTLRGVFDRGPFLHEGKVETLDEVLRDLHAPEKVGGAALTPAERHDLIEFLKTL
jgi:YVTN family beta-propeller protein